MRQGLRRRNARGVRRGPGLPAALLCASARGRCSGLLLSGGLGVGDEADERGFQVVGVALGHQPRRSVAGQHGPRVHQGDPIAPQCFVHEMGGDEDRHPLTAREVDEQLPELIAGDRVHARGRLVQQEHIGLVQDGDRQGEPLLEPQWELLRRCVEVRAQAEAVHQFIDPGASPVSGQVEDLGVEIEVLPHRQLAVKREGLRHVADPIAGGQVVGVHGLAEELRLAFGGGKQAGEHLHRGGLAAAIRAEEAEDLAAADGEAHAIDGGEAAEALGEVRGLDGRLAAGVHARGDHQGATPPSSAPGSSATNASSRLFVPVRSINWAGVPVAITRPASMAMVQSKRWASSM